MKIIGVDPGMGGAIAYLTDDELIIEDMPVFVIRKGKTKRRQIDDVGLLDVFKEFGDADHVYIENVSAQFGNGAAAAFTFGWGCGALRMAVTASRIPFTYVTPQKWKKVMGCTADKGSSLMRAKQLFPVHADYFARKKDADRAEAALISLYGSRILTNPLDI